MRRSKIVCTLGPATSSPERIGELIDAGMDVARLNASHGDHDGLRRMREIVADEARKRGKAVATLLDLQGPKIRVGKFADGSVELAKGARFTITTDSSVVGDVHRVNTSYTGLPGDVKPGDQILLDDGYLSLVVVEISGNDVITEVETGGVLSNHKGINLPNVAVSAPALTDKDRKDLELGVDMGVEYIALSFVRNPEDVAEAKRLAMRGNAEIPVIAKIEKPHALERLDDIIAVADGLMVARGDLGVELGPEKVPLVQKRIIEATNAYGKVVITATQMLESMIHNPRPTRAEVSDVANAVLDGTDALMLSGETAVGKYPAEVVRTMSRVIEEIETSEHFRQELETPELDFRSTTNAIAEAAVVAAREMELHVIATVTRTGDAARLVSEYRPEANIVALTPHEITARRLALYWGVTPLLLEPGATTDETLNRVQRALIDNDLAKPGDAVVITMCVPPDSNRKTNMLEIHRMS